MSNVARAKKVRSDKGLVMATLRDLFCIKWIAEMYAARFDQIQQLLSRFPDKQKPFKDGRLIAATTTKDLIARWQRAGWIEYRRVLADGKGFAWVTKKGLALVDLDQTFAAKAPALTRLNHIYAVNQIRLWMDQQGFDWTSERRYRAGLSKPKKGDIIGPIPDGLVTHEKYGKVAIEVEISPKKPVDVQSKLHQLMAATMTDNATLKTVYTFPVVWFYVPSQPMKTLIENARLELIDQDQKRISVGLEAHLIA